VLGHLNADTLWKHGEHSFSLTCLSSLDGWILMTLVMGMVPCDTVPLLSEFGEDGVSHFAGWFCCCFQIKGKGICSFWAT
jgi:hypothetical protein